MPDLNGLNGLNPDAKKAIDSAFDTMNKWRDDVAAATDRYSDQIFDRMSAAAKSAGWPDTFVEATRGHIQNVAKIQTQMIDQVMDVWKDQLKNPGSMPNLSQFTPPGAGASNPFAVPGMPPGVPMNPMQFWMQAAEAWQKMLTGGR